MTRRIRIHLLSIFVVSCAAVTASAQPTGHEGVQVVRVEVKDLADFDLLRSLIESDSRIRLWSEVLMVGDVDVRVAPGAMQLLDAAGLCADVVISDLQDHIDALYAKPRGGGFFDSLATYDEHVQFMQDLVAAHPSIAEMISIGTSVEGRTIWALRITGPGPSKDAVLFHGAQHGDEQDGASMVAYIADHLVSHYDTDSEIARLVNGLEWFLVPISNPDGYETFDRFNANGADLNRNWGGPGSDPDAFSQPETRALRDLLVTNARIRLHVDIHGYVPWFMWPWGHTQELCVDDATFGAVGQRFRDSVLAGTGQQYRIGASYHVAYPVYGGSVDYSYGDLGRWGFVFEMLGAQYTGYLPGNLDLAEWILDCNENGAADWGDFMMGNSADCNANQTPDECEYPDCNGNGRLDECELLDGSATDNDGNHRLDECESDCAITPNWVKLFAEDGTRRQQFGWAVDVEDATIVVGAISDHDQGYISGSAYVFAKTRAGWAQTQELITDDAPHSSYYSLGRAVAVSGDVAIVGARGAAYVFRLMEDTWVQESKFVGTDDSFGMSVDLLGDVALVGEPDAELAIGLSLGKVHVFVFDGAIWQPQDTLSPDSDMDTVRFGHAVSISANRIHIAAIHDQCLGNVGKDAPVSYFYEYDGLAWRRVVRQEPHPGWVCETNELDAAISGNTAVLGTPWRRPIQLHHGAAYVFEFDGQDWGQPSELLRYEPGHRRFGTSVAVDAGRVVISDEDGSYLYVYQPRGQGWAESLELTLPPVRDSRRTVALHDGTLVVGAEYADGAVSYSGAVYVLDDFTELTSDCSGNGIQDGCEAFLFGDANSDGSQGLDDFAAMEQCLAGPLSAPDPPVADCAKHCLAVFDSNGDGHVDIADVALFQRLFD